MVDHENLVVTTPLVTEVAPAPLRRVSWGAIFAGAIISIMLQLLLTLLGLGFAVSTIDPRSEVNPIEGLGWFSIGWWVASSLIALFVGGWAAGRLAGVPRWLDGALNGVIAWGVATLLMIYLLTTTAGALMGGAISVVRTGLEAAGRTATVAVAPAVEQVVTEALAPAAPPAGERLTRDQVLQEAREILRQSARPAPAPAVAPPATTGTTEGVPPPPPTEPAVTPEQTQQALAAILDRLLGEADVDKTARENAINLLVERTTLDREAARTVDRWIKLTRPAETKVEQVAEKVEQKTEQVSAEAVRIAACTAFWTFGLLFVGALAAFLGGALGSPRDLVLQRVR